MFVSFFFHSFGNPYRCYRNSKHSDIYKGKTKSYTKKQKGTNPETLKEWRHHSYLNRKAKFISVHSMLFIYTI